MSSYTLSTYSVAYMSQLAVVLSLRRIFQRRPKKQPNTQQQQRYQHQNRSGGLSERETRETARNIQILGLTRRWLSLTLTGGWLHLKLTLFERPRKEKEHVAKGGDDAAARTGRARGLISKVEDHEGCCILHITRLDTKS
jgi:hypothetical protein